MPRVGRRVQRSLIALIAVTGLLLAACSDDEDGSATTDPASGQEEFNRDGMVSVGYDLVQPGSQAGFSLDPVEQPSATNDGLLYMVYGRLMRPTNDGGAELDLAESADIVDESTIEIELREDATFQDGTPFDAGAVKAGLERSLEAESSAFGAGFFSLESIEATGDTSLRLDIPDGTAASWYDAYLPGWQSTIVKPDTNFDMPVGAGPMQVTDMEPDQSLTLERWEDFYNADSINFGGMELIHILDDTPAAAPSALQAGQVDIVTTVVEQLPSLGEGYASLTIPTDTLVVNMMTCKRDDPLNDPRVRVALNKAIDREAVSEAVFAGTADPATQPWPEGHRFFNPDVADVLAYDPDEARRLLEEAGYADGVSVDVYSLPASGLPSVAEVIEQQWAEVGVTMNLNIAPNFVDAFLRPEAAGLGLIPSVSAGNQRLAHWTGDSVSNACGFESEELAELGAELATTSASSDEAQEVWYQIDEVVTNEALSIFIVWSPVIGAYDEAALDDPQVWPIGFYALPNVYGDGMLA